MHRRCDYPDPTRRDGRTVCRVCGGRLPEPKQFTREELAAAKARLDATPDRGTDDEYAEALLDELFAWGRQVAARMSPEEIEATLWRVRQQHKPGRASSGGWWLATPAMDVFGVMQHEEQMADACGASSG